MNCLTDNNKYVVSVIIPCFNCEKTIERAVWSAINQGVKIEIILVDDCSSDDTSGVISRLAEEFDCVKAIFNKNNMGPGFSRNRGMDLAGGRYIAFLDSDDVWLTGKLTQQVAFMESNQLDFSYHDYYEVTVNAGKMLSARLAIAPDVAELPGYYYKRGYGMCLTSMISRSKLASIRFPEDRSLSTEDYFFFLLLLSSGVKGRRLGKPLGVYMMLQASRSSNKLRQARSVLKSNLRAANSAAWSAYYYFVRYAIAQLMTRTRPGSDELGKSEFEQLSSTMSLGFDARFIVGSVRASRRFEDSVEQVS